VCYTLKEAPADRQRIGGEQSPKRVSVSHAMFLWFCDFFRLFSMSMIQRFLFFDLSTGAGARK
jgi:hypothetical protein